MRLPLGVSVEYRRLRCLRPRLFLRAAILATTCLSPALAKAQAVSLVAATTYDANLANFAFSSGLSIFTVVVALTYLSERKDWRRRATALTDELDEANAELERARTFLACEKQILVSWSGPDSAAKVDISSLRLPDNLPAGRVLAFDLWLATEDAASLTAALDRLRRKGEAFRQQLTGLTRDRYFEAEGCVVGFNAVLRIREVSGERLELIELRQRYATIESELLGVRALLDAGPAPVWIRNAEGALTFVNAAYVAAVEAKTSEEAIGKGAELLDPPDRKAAAKARMQGALWRESVTATVAGQRHLLDVTQTTSPQMTAAIAIDRHEVTIVRADLERQMQSHKRTLDQLPTAVAIFDRSKRLIYYNDAYAKLWQIDQGFLEQEPTDGEILDRLRADQRVPAESDYKAWKQKLFESYCATEPARHVWHLPDGRILDVVAHPNTQGGVTYLYDDTTRAYELETRFNALNRTQSETLETLREGVAVFGPDGRLSFCNPAFIDLWRLEASRLAERPRFEILAAQCRAFLDDDEAWRELQNFVTSFNDMREGFTRRMSRNDGLVVDCTAQSLLDGAALLTFVDVTADVSAERALLDRNKALLAAEKLRNDFIHHVSYELRSPLNNINGFVHLLNEQSTGRLNAKQLEYLGYVSKSSAALLAIIDDILDLATIDENAMTLELSDIDIDSTMRSAIEGVQDRLEENDIDVQIVAMDNVGSFRGDSRRVRQILFNLLSNAVGFSRPGQTVTLAAMRRGDEIVFKVTDRGRGIAPEVLERIFDRFESHTTGSRHRGVGLGLSIVRALVELHGGKVFVDSAPGEGTTVTCVFPAGAQEQRLQLVNQGGA
jgi:signal transduction histidine kinase